MAQRVKLTLDTLGMMTGHALSEAFNEKVQQAIKSCQDYPGYEKPRQISVIISFTPQMEKDGTGTASDYVAVQATIKSSFPAQKTNVYRVMAHQDGSASFHPDLPDDPDGDSLYDNDTIERERKHRE